jgi:lipoyl(octanoyl) transferase
MRTLWSIAAGRPAKRVTRAKLSQGGFDLVKSDLFDENFVDFSAAPTRWLRSTGLIDYSAAVAAMETHVSAIAAGKAPELAWFLEHPALYTAGTSARPEDLIDAAGLPVYATGRGGQFTYHGPGQRVVYLMLDLGRRGRDVRAFVRRIEAWLIDALGRLGIEGGCRSGRTGIWVRRPEKGEGREDKIAAIGIRVRRWVSFHGVSINLAPDLDRFAGIVPCGIRDQGVTSFADLGRDIDMAALDQALLAAFISHFGETRPAAPEEFAPFSAHLRSLC